MVLAVAIAYARSGDDVRALTYLDVVRRSAMFFFVHYELRRDFAHQVRSRLDATAIAQAQAASASLDIEAILDRGASPTTHVRIAQRDTLKLAGTKLRSAFFDCRAQPDAGVSQFAPRQDLNLRPADQKACSTERCAQQQVPGSSRATRRELSVVSRPNQRTAHRHGEPGEAS